MSATESSLGSVGSSNRRCGDNTIATAMQQRMTAMRNAREQLIALNWTGIRFGIARQTKSRQGPGPGLRRPGDLPRRQHPERGRRRS